MCLAGVPVDYQTRSVEHFRSRSEEVDFDRLELSNVNLKRLTMDLAYALIASFDLDEIRTTVRECGRDKTPGLGDFNFNFIKRFWHWLSLILKL